MSLKREYEKFLLGLLFRIKLDRVLFIPAEDKVSRSMHHVAFCHHVDFLVWIWCIFSFLPSAVSMEMHICLVGETQRPTECVGTVNIDHNTIYWVRYIGQLTAGGSITMETCSKPGSSQLLLNMQQLLIHAECQCRPISCVYAGEQDVSLKK